MEPWQSWALAVAGGGLAYYYYTSQTRQRPNRTRAGSVQAEASPLERSQPASKASKRENKPKRKPAGAAPSEASSSEAVSTAREEKVVQLDSKKKRKNGQKPTTSNVAATSRIADEDDASKEEDSADKAWAEQLASLRKGTNLAPPPRTDAHSRTVRQGVAGASPAISSASSVGGADAADDELSPALSPNIRGGDVSDMLESAPAGPSILRLTSPANDKPTKQVRQQKEFQTAESKKQRQNRQKIEERKLERDAAEKDRQVKLEAQRRIAREARGEPARNGIPISKPSANNAWAQKTAALATQAPVVASSDGPLLDTFEPDAESTSSSTGGLNNSTDATSMASNWESEVPAKEDQIRTIQQHDEDVSGWNTVAGKKKQKKADAAVDGVVDDDKVPVRAVKAEKPAAPKTQAPKTNGFAWLDDQASKLDAGSHPDDSQWSA